MNPKISNISEESDLYRVTLSGINVSIANAIRRIILSEIPVTTIQTDSHETNDCKVIVNTGRLHNEILKHRLSCIPIIIKELDLLPEKYILEVNVSNESDNMRYVTTEDFRIKNKSNGNYLTAEETRKIFPPNAITNMYIDFARLRPKISDSIPGEHIHLEAEFSVHCAKDNSMYNVVSKCAYANTPDIAKIESTWSDIQEKWVKEGLSKDEVQFQKKNYMLLDAQRQFVPDSFDFVVQTLGIYENSELLKTACAILQNKFLDLIQAVESDTLLILTSETTMDYCYDVMLENEDYTVGKVLEYILYENFYQGKAILNFCGFKKFHPHNKDSTVRIAFSQNTDRNMVRQVLKEAGVSAAEVFKKIYKMF